MHKKIVTEQGTTKKLMETFGTSNVTVKRALDFETNTPLAMKIRQEALQLGGIVMESEHVRQQLERMDEKKRADCLKALRLAILSDRPFRRMKVANAIEKARTLQAGILGSPASEAIGVLIDCGKWMVELEEKDLLNPDEFINPDNEQ